MQVGRRGRGLGPALFYEMPRLAPELSQLKYISGSEQYPRLPGPREDLGRVCPNIHLGSHTSGGCDEVLGELTQSGSSLL